MTGPVFAVTTVLDADVCALQLSGALDLDGTGQLRAALADCFARRPGRIVLDLKSLLFCDCAGLNGLLEARMRAGRVGSELCVVGARTQVARLFFLAGVDKWFADTVPRLPPRTM
ncbi:STAS domain-containing protein [Streptomyces sp. ISL-66]|uniref:STAS domain-containing protein n=1 Tax=Streptomyces sp. ISL-66 TaxID=2819186 RepID=UPI001BEC3C4F|nr:STAS domain-containing protein [Streptomyces sp. ISL-66]MBT2468984.1 STAS domain-containing protein [Streptomyces sp. ISL-66]